MSASAEFTPYSPNLEEQNQELLRASELGVIMERAYLDAINEDPRIAKVRVISITDPTEKRPAFATPDWENGEHQVHIRLDNLDETLATFRDVMRRSPGTVTTLAETLDVRPEEVTPQLLFVQSTLHEFGHTLEFDDYRSQGKTAEEHRHDVKVEGVKRPLGGLIASKLLDPTSKQYLQIADNWDVVARQENVTSMDELFDKTAVAHRHTKFEHDADRFAASILQSQPLMVEQLTGDIDRLRNYPQAA